MAFSQVAAQTNGAFQLTVFSFDAQTPGAVPGPA